MSIGGDVAKIGRKGVLLLSVSGGLGAGEVCEKRR